MAVEVPSCPDADREGVRLIAEDRTAFDLDFDGRSHLAVVQREEGVLRIHELREDGAAELLHEIQAQEGDLEEVFALPGGRGFLATEILDEEPKTLLLLVDPVSGRRAEGRFAGMCWVSSVAWDPRRSEALLGCETSPDLFAFDPEAMAVRTVGKLPGWADAEDLWLREDGELLYSVSLAEGDALRWIDPSTATVLREQPIGGFNYSVLHDPPTDRVFVARFHDSSVLAFDGETGAEQGRVRVGFGVRPLEPVPGRRLLLAASMFGGTVSFLDPDELKVRERVRLGGRVKGLAVAPAGDRAWLSSTCGTFELDLDRLAPGEAGGRQ